MNTSYFLYAEDDQDDIDILRDALKSAQKDLKMETVVDGYEVLKYLQQVKASESYPSLIILDLKLPRLNGTETLQLLKTDDIYRMIPVLIFSSKASAADTSYCNNLGAEVLAKPTGFGEWGGIIRQMCSYVDEE